jgi:hypothetical protein
MTANEYAGGIRYTSGTSGIGTDTLAPDSSRDRIFHIDMSLPENTDTSVYMTASEASDVLGVEYYFTCVAGGGNDSSWQDGTTYVDTGLSSGTQYTYTVTARDISPSQNETAPSTAESATTTGG